MSGRAVDGQRAGAPARELRPGPALTDVRKPPVDGVATIRPTVRERLADELVPAASGLGEYAFDARRAR